MRLGIICIAVLLGITAARASVATALNSAERSRLQFQLENLYNGVDLLIRNSHSDELDFQQQARLARYLKMYKRIPLKPRIGEIRSELMRSAKAHGVRVLGVRYLKKPGHAPAQIPKSVLVNQDFRLSPDQIAQSLRFRLTLSGPKDKIRSWILKWDNLLVRVIQPVSGAKHLRLHSLGGDRWSVDIRAFRFRKLRFPTLRFRNPSQLLPAWARRDPKRFARSEPLLAGLIRKTDRELPAAKILLRSRGPYLLQDARMNFFLRKTGAQP